ncbi:methyl-accepting chemotaxis protein [Sphingosinicella sp.]|uniref:methyl-accepting chemotaxis protein n=1 Tax=Sphingosinicella sp. TaxID=1917971 RepID=UPI00261535CD|nr:methyl-accepting chemotaxis protein [Sphingosinicella sp.]
MSDAALVPIRRAGARLLVGAFAANCVVLGAVGLTAGKSGAFPVVAIAVALTLIPTVWVFRSETVDAAQRIALALTAVCFPGLFLYLMSGHLWQMDMHMYFFAMLAGLTVLCDRRALIAAAGLIAVHHLAFSILAPDWVFAGGGDIPRVMLHAVIVVLQTGMLLWVVGQLSALITGKAEEVQRSLALQVEADVARGEAEASLKALKIAQAEAERHRAAEESMRRAAEAADRRRLVADALEARLGAIVSDLNSMGVQLASSKEELVRLLSGAALRSEQLRKSHRRAEQEVRAVAADTGALVSSIHAVGTNSGEVRDTARAAASATRQLEPEINSLGGTVDAASQILGIISQVAAQSHMLSFNAAIEAARQSGDGSGFLVVASEMKLLSSQTAEATRQIERHLTDIRAATASVSSAISDATGKVLSIDVSTAGIVEAVSDQIRATTEIAAAADEMAAQIDAASGDVEALDRVLSEVANAMQQADQIATSVSARSVELDQTVRSVLAELRAA